MWRMPQGNFFGRVAEFLGFSHWDFLHLGRKRLEQGEKKKGGIGRKKEMDYKEKEWNREKNRKNRDKKVGIGRRGETRI